MSTFIRGDSPSDYTHALSIKRESSEFYNTRDKHGYIRPDFLFSYWVYIWFVIYAFILNYPETKWNKYIINNFNPLLALYVALFENLVVFAIVIVYNPEFWLLIKYIAMLLLIKIMPIYILRNTDISWAHDVKYLAYLFLIYNLYLYLEDTDIFSIYNTSVISLLKNQDRTPMMSIFKYISENIPFINKKLHGDIL
jgi:hypothetical protein